MYVFRHSSNTDTVYAQTLPWFPPLFCVFFPLLIFATPARRHCVMTTAAVT
jgi:hypothetical protein